MPKLIMKAFFVFPLPGSAHGLMSLQAMKLPLERLDDNQDPEPLQRALICGLFLHAARRQSDGGFLPSVVHDARP